MSSERDALYLTYTPDLHPESPRSYLYFHAKRSSSFRELRSWATDSRRVHRLSMGFVFGFSTGSCPADMRG